MALSDQVRRYRLERGLTQAELARRARISKAYLSQLESGSGGTRPSADILYRLAFALGTSAGELLEKQNANSQGELPQIPPELWKLGEAEALADEDLKMLARIEYRGERPRTFDDWKFLYESIKRTIRPGGG